MPLLPITDAAAARAVLKDIAARLQAEGVDDFRKPPQEPASSCSRGCEGCVWESYFATVGWWRADTAEILEDRA
ncbi:oxidoreductase-like domain-containing protein [Variovorax sp. KK3]|uniref:oxidoreductase-like domain-containing protein n=1 Tax=Variovorax sp. KK3 TaxID=1855728 RepID=UPI00097CA142|nr:oxidoreductase-like domain-containing protein [Variovorax sp. KK3]